MSGAYGIWSTPLWHYCVYETPGRGPTMHVAGASCDYVGLVSTVG